MTDENTKTERSVADCLPSDCKHALACHTYDFHDGGADAEQCLVDCEIMGDFMEIGFDCGKGHCRLYERRKEAAK